jgi:hypothetical protein
MRVNTMKNNSAQGSSRRSFIGGAAATLGAISILPRHVLGGDVNTSPNEKLNLACVGVGGMQGKTDVRGVRSENIYALCDVDSRQFDKVAEFAPKAKRYKDYRVMLDKEAKNLDGITITTPDHTHANIALHAMELGLAVYCQKPLTHTIWEARQLKNAAKKYNAITQMGNQGYSSEGTRIASEIIWSGKIGDVTEVHSGFDRQFAGHVKSWPKPVAVPDYLDWDLWLNRCDRPYGKGIHTCAWRGFFDFGSQMIGDWGVHMLGPAHLGLALSNPLSVECFAIGETNEVTFPAYACKIDFPERPNPHVPGTTLPPVSVYWYEGGMFKKTFPLPEGLAADTMKKYNTLFKGTEGYMGTSGRGTGVRLLPKESMKGFKKPKRILERVKGGHYKNWCDAIKTGKAACSNFDVAAPYVEWLLLGTIACRFPNQKLMWDAKNMRFTNNDAANEFVKPSFRSGWEIPEIKV